MRTLPTHPAARALALGVGIALAAPVSSAALLAPSVAMAAPEGGEHGGDHGEDHSGEHGDDHGGEHHGHAVDPLGDANNNGTIDFIDPESALAAETTFGTMPAAAMWGFQLFNLALFAGILVWFGRKPIAAFLSDRSKTIRKELEDAATVEEEAKARYQQLEARLSGFEDEVAQMRAESDKMSQAERERTLARANEAAERIQKSAERSIRDETARARKALRAEAVDLAVKLAEDTLRREVASSDRERLARDFLDSLQADSGGTHG